VKVAGFDPPLAFGGKVFEASNRAVDRVQRCRQLSCEVVGVDAQAVTRQEFEPTKTREAFAGEPYPIDQSSVHPP
jgi:hypothetical protein